MAIKNHDKGHRGSKVRLTDRQRAFISNYVAHWNATRAAKEAGYSEKNASRLAIEVLGRPHVQAEIQKIQQERFRENDITADRLVKEYACIAFSNMADYQSWNLNGSAFCDSENLTRDQSAAISEISTVVGENSVAMRMKLHSKIAALDALAKKMGLFKEDNEQQQNNTTILLPTKAPTMAEWQSIQDDLVSDEVDENA